MKGIDLTRDAIPSLLRISHGQKQSFIVQAFNFKKVMRQNYAKVQLSDGTNSTKAIFNMKKPDLDLSLVGKPYGERPTYLIAIIEHTTHNFQGGNVLEILNFLPLQPPHHRSSSESGDDHERNERRNFEMFRQQPKNTVVAVSKPKQESRLIIAENELGQFQNISDLYADYQGWQIVVRVLDTIYKEFNSKAGKLTKICTLRLIDRFGMKIEATMFGEEAKDLHKNIQEDQVYKIGKGQIKENGYNQHYDDNVSRFTIILTKNSEIMKVQDLKCIPQACEALITLSEVLNEINFEKQYDIIVVLLEIGMEHIIQKLGKVIYKRSIIVGDPEKKMSIQGIIWGKNTQIEEEWIGKPVLLKCFKLNNYRESLSLTSTFKSEIVPKAYNKFTSLLSLKIDYASVSMNQKDKQKQASDCNVQKFIRDIQNEVSYIKDKQHLISDLQFWITFINFKNKWFYEACNNPKCKKQAESHSKCLYCGTFNEAVVKKFILPIEITDFTGSLWTTAFDDFACQIFKNCTLDQLTKMTDFQLKEEGEKRLYLQFKGRVSTKRGDDGTIRHTFLGKPAPLTIEKAMTGNLEKIKKALF